MSQSDWQKGDFAARKGKLCEITHIDFALHPPAVTVKMLDGGHEVGTEFSKLTKVPAPKWSCGVCTFDNNLNEQVCTVCMQGKRTNEVYKRALARVENAIYNQNKNNNNGNQNNNNIEQNRATHWQCTLCTFNNEMSNDECQMCYSIRSKDAKLIYPNNSNIENNNQNNNNNNNNDNSDNQNNNNNNNNNNSNQQNENENKNDNENNNKINNDNDEKIGENGNNENNKNEKKSEGNNQNDKNDNKEKEKEKDKDKSESDENISNDSEWTLIDKTELNEEDQNNNNENENENENEKNEKSDPYMDVE